MSYRSGFSEVLVHIFTLHFSESPKHFITPLIDRDSIFNLSGFSIPSAGLVVVVALTPFCARSKSTFHSSPNLLCLVNVGNRGGCASAPLTYNLKNSKG